MDPNRREGPPANVQMLICSFRISLSPTFTVFSLSLPVLACISCQLECTLSLLSDHPWLSCHLLLSNEASPIKTHHYSLQKKDSLTFEASELRTTRTDCKFSLTGFLMLKSLFKRDIIVLNFIYIIYIFTLFFSELNWIYSIYFHKLLLHLLFIFKYK